MSLVKSVKAVDLYSPVHHVLVATSYWLAERWVNVAYFNGVDSMLVNEQEFSVTSYRLITFS